MGEKIAGELSAASRCISAANPCSGQGAAHGIDGVVMQFKKFFWRAAPVTDVRLIPDLPVPRLHFSAPIFLDAVFRPLVDQLGPLLVIRWRIGPAGENRAVILARAPMMLIRLWFDGKLLRHETDLGVRPHSALQAGVEDAIQNCPVVNGVAGRVFAVNACGTPLQGW